MVLTDTQIAIDIGNIFESLASTGANEDIILVPSTGAESTFKVIRAKTLTARELKETGWANRYQLSVYAANADGFTASKGDIITMSVEGDLRILQISRGPATGYIRFDLGDQYSGGV